MKEHIKKFEEFLNEASNVKTVRVFITNERYSQWSRKTPIFVSMLQRFNDIKPDEWTEYQKVNHTLLGTLRNWFEVEIED